MKPGYEHGHQLRHAPLKGAALWLVAAVMLLFQGAAGGILSASLSGSDASSTFGITARGVPPGALPRDVPKSLSDNAVIQKARPTHWLLDGPPQALPAELSFSTTPSRIVSRAARHEAIAPSGASSPYRARAPPSLSL